MEKFEEQCENTTKLSKSYFIPSSDENDEDFIEATYVPPSELVNVPRQRHASTPLIKKFHKSQDYEYLKKHLCTGEYLFEDEKFPASKTLLKEIQYFEGRRVLADEIKWLRPHVSVFNILKLLT